MSEEKAKASRLRADIEKRLPSAFTTYRRDYGENLPTGIFAIDSLVQGIPLHGVTEICGTSYSSSGKTSVVVSMLAQASQDHFCALVDASDSFDPRSAQAAGVNLKRVLWVRGGGRDIKALEHAFKLADMLLQGCGGFAVVLVDLAGISERAVRKVPLNTWFRFARVVEKLDTALVFATPCSVVGTCSSLTLNLSAGQVRWSQPTPDSPPHTHLVAALDFRVEIAARRFFKRTPQSVSGFSARRRWA